MGMPSINITFQTLGGTAIQRSQKGVVGVILKDAKLPGEHILASAADIPPTLGQENKDYLSRAFLGYINPPKKVIVYVMDGTNKTLEDALRYFALQQFDYLCGMPALTTEEAKTLAAWVKSERQNDHNVKAVLPETAADNEGVVNFATNEIAADGKTYTAAQYCSRIAGLIAGTPMEISGTFAPLPEVSDVKRLSKAEMDAAEQAGKFILFHDGEKVKTGRAVNSLVTFTPDKGAAFRKIKIVEAVDMMENDIRRTAEDSYIGKYPNSYDNKLLLATAIKGYLESLEASEILQKGFSKVGVDTAAQENYLKSQGIDTSGMNEQDIKEADTGSRVFLAASVKVLDVIEDIDLTVTI